MMNAQVQTRIAYRTLVFIAVFLFAAGVFVTEAAASSVPRYVPNSAGSGDYDSYNTAAYVSSYRVVPSYIPNYYPAYASSYGVVPSYVPNYYPAYVPYYGGGGASGNVAVFGKNAGGYVSVYPSYSGGVAGNAGVVFRTKGGVFGSINFGF